MPLPSPMPSPDGVLVAAAGNIFLGDDGFGCEVARRLAEVELPDGMEVRDYGIAGLHLAHDLLDGPETLLLIDTIARGAEPGSLVLLEVTEEDVDGGQLETHGMDPATVLASLRALGGTMPRTLVLGCEPRDVIEHIGLSPPVAAAVDIAVDRVLEVVASERQRQGGTTRSDSTPVGIDTRDR